MGCKNHSITKKRFKNANLEEDVKSTTITGTNHQAVVLPVKLKRLAGVISGDSQTLYVDLVGALNVAADATGDVRL